MSLAPDGTLKELIEKLVEKWGDELAAVLVDSENGEPLPHNIYLINSRYTNVPEDLETPLHDGDEVTFIPPIFGG